MEGKYLITTPLFYASGEPHIGHAYTLTLANLFKKYFELIGKKVYLLCGVDEHGEKILSKAREEKKSPQKFTEEKSLTFKKLVYDLEIENHHFIRTTSEEHKAFVRKLFQEFLERGEIYYSDWNGYKCINCESNYSEKYFSRNKYCELGHNLLLRREKSYFLRIKKFREWLLTHYSERQIFLPSQYLTDLREGYLNELEDLSISREGLEWGIKLNEDSNFCIYVWFDALCGYISNSKVLELWKEKNIKIIQIIGKEIFRFHSLYFPIILKLKELSQVDKLIVHGWLLNEKNRKISKSELTKAEDEKSISRILQKFNIESIRWFCIFLNWERDHPFSENLLSEYYNKYLVNLFGNLINRLKGILKKTDFSTQKLKKKGEFKTSEFTKSWNVGSEILSKLEEKIESFELHSLIKSTISLLEDANSLVERFQPWKLASNSIEYRELGIFLLRQLTISAFVFSPIFSKNHWEKIQKALSIKTSMGGKLNLNYLNSVENFEQIKLSPPEPLFQKYL